MARWGAALGLVGIYVLSEHSKVSLFWRCDDCRLWWRCVSSVPSPSFQTISGCTLSFTHFSFSCLGASKIACAKAIERKAVRKRNINKHILVHLSFNVFCSCFVIGCNNLIHSAQSRANLQQWDRTRAKRYILWLPLRSFVCLCCFWHKEFCNCRPCQVACHRFAFSCHSRSSHVIVVQQTSKTRSHWYDSSQYGRTAG